MKEYNLREYMSAHPLVLDGAMGTLLQGSGLAVGESPESLLMKNPELIEMAHRSYYDAGANLVLTNTFGANPIKMSDAELSLVIPMAVSCAVAAKEKSLSHRPKWVALDIGPLGRMLEPIGDLSVESAIELFGRVVELGVASGVDAIFIETMTDLREARAALIAAKERCSLPVFVSCAFGSDGRLLTGADAETVVNVLSSLGADAIGVNCSEGPRALRPVVESFLELSPVPVLCKANAGLPRDDGKGGAVYDMSPREFAEEIKPLISLGLHIAGGCCGTNPDFIRAVSEALGEEIRERRISPRGVTLSSNCESVTVGDKPLLIGERINPTGKPRLKAALLSGDLSAVEKIAVSEEDAGAHILDVNVGAAGVDEVSLLPEAVKAVEGVTGLPLCIDSANPEAMERALRIYSGVALINSVTGDGRSMERIFPLAKKYGGAIIALTLDERGIPDTVEGRVEIAERIIESAESYGIDRHRLIFDPLTLAVSADGSAALTTLRTVRILTERGLYTSLGVSNVSFGLPARELVNSTFLSLAICNGLSAAIVNPESEAMKNAYYSSLALLGFDPSMRAYISHADGAEEAPRVEKNTDISLKYAIIHGLCSEAERLTRELLATKEALDIVDAEIIPALNTVGERYESGKAYLPSLIQSAEAAAAAAEVIKESLGDPSCETEKGALVVIATVEGDIHDIGKGIVKLLLENYGFRVIDLGKSVSAEKIVEAAEVHAADIVALSALMTTTLPAMERTVALVKQRLPECRVMVGGAVLTQEFADRIGADGYAADALSAVRLAEAMTGGDKV